MSFDLDAYLERIQARGAIGQSEARGATGLRELHRAHVTSIPFENLDPYRGTPVSLAMGDLQEKLVSRRRGGYCFEHNLLLAGALEALGLRVEPMLARVRYGAPAGATRPRTHLLLRVHAEGETWHADVGFGRATLLEPLPFGPGEVHEQMGWRYQVIEDEGELVLRTRENGEWTQLYGFVPEPAPLIDIETGNWFACTHPTSRFVTGLIASRQRPDGSRVSLSDWSGKLVLSEQTPERTQLTPVAREAAGRLLAEHFGLAGFSLTLEREGPSPA
jgi:N-hydroxyarylamine O-acetyltransferase